MIRDQALAISGLLVEKVGGPSVRPYQPDGRVGRDQRLRQPAELQARQGRRPLSPQPLHHLEADGRAADHDCCSTRRAARSARCKRSRTNTPLQALALLNDVTFVEASRAPGRADDERRRRDAGGAASRYAFRPRHGAASPARGELQILAAGLQSTWRAYRRRSRRGEEAGRRRRVAARSEAAMPPNWPPTR